MNGAKDRCRGPPRGSGGADPVAPVALGSVEEPVRTGERALGGFVRMDRGDACRKGDLAERGIGLAVAEAFGGDDRADRIEQARGVAQTDAAQEHCKLRAAVPHDGQLVRRRKWRKEAVQNEYGLTGRAARPGGSDAEKLARDAKRTVLEIPLTRHDIYVADECFLTGTAAEVVAVIDLDGRPIGTGKPGPVTNDLLERFRTLTRPAR